MRSNIIKFFTILFIIVFIFDLNGVIPSSFIAIIIFITLLSLTKLFNIKGNYNPKSKINFLYFKNQINSQIVLLKKNKNKKKLSLPNLNNLLIFFNLFQKLNDFTFQFKLKSESSEINKQVIVLLQSTSFIIISDNFSNDECQIITINDEFCVNYPESELTIWQN